MLAFFIFDDSDAAALAGVITSLRPSRNSAAQASEAAANRRVAQLREQGFRDVSVIRDTSPRRWGISLGVFSKPELAEAQLAALRQAGVSDARVEEHPLNTSRFAYQLVGLDDGSGDALKKLLAGFTGTALRDCP